MLKLVMYKQFLFALIAALAACMGAWAQGISVTSFKPLPDDLTANIAGSMEKDQNGEVAALIKVVTTQTGFTFEGGMAGIVKTKQEAGEIWVYVPHGIQKITIKHPQLGVLRNYYFPCAIDAARTYEMVLASGEVRTVVTQDAGGSYLVISLQPKTAVVYIDDQLQENDGSGEMMKALTYGEHQYRVEANGYIPEAGIVTIGKEKKVLNINLQSAHATLTVNSTTPGTQIVVNEQVKGSGNWSGNLTPGMYIIEGRLDSHRSQKMSVTLGKQEQKAITIPALEPMYGMLDVSYKPIGAEIWLDGKQLGASPDIYKNVFTGTHKLTIKKAGYTDHTETITLAEGERKTITGALTAKNAVTQVIGRGHSGNKSTVSGEVYQRADNMPEFPGGQGAMFRWLGENLKYPPIALEEGIQGRVLIHFVVTKTGEIADAKVAKSVNPALDKEALRLVRSMPRFTPAKMQGKPVNCYYTLPVTFRITTN